MSEQSSAFAFHRITRERLHDTSVVAGLKDLEDFPAPRGEANHLMITATNAERMVGVAQLNYVPGAWLGHMVVCVSPELNGQTGEVIEQWPPNFAATRHAWV